MEVYLGESYEDLTRAAALCDSAQGKDGLTVRAMQRVAKQLGRSLKFRKRVDLDEDYGILLLDDHALVIRNGLVFDVEVWRNKRAPRDTLVWDVHDWLAAKKYKPVGILVEESA